MGSQSNRQMILSAIAMGALFFMLTLFWSDSDWMQAAVGAPIFAVVMYFSYRMTNRVMRRFRPPPPEPEPWEPAEPTSTRPVHAQRRRRSRRRRGSRGRSRGTPHSP